MRKTKKIKNLTVGIIFTIVVAVVGYFNTNSQGTPKTVAQNSYELNSIPEYNNEPYVVLNDNIPEFTEADYTTESFEKYSELDSLGRCGVAYANICRETMPKEDEERGDISSVKPTGWVQKRYDGEYLYNRCHLIRLSII